MHYIQNYYDIRPMIHHHLTPETQHHIDVCFTPDSSAALIYARIVR